MRPYFGYGAQRSLTCSPFSSDCRLFVRSFGQRSLACRVVRSGRRYRRSGGERFYKKAATGLGCRSSLLTPSEGLRAAIHLQKGRFRVMGRVGWWSGYHWRFSHCSSLLKLVRYRLCCKGPDDRLQRPPARWSPAYGRYGQFPASPARQLPEPSGPRTRPASRANGAMRDLSVRRQRVIEDHGYDPPHHSRDSHLGARLRDCGSTIRQRSSQRREPRLAGAATRRRTLRSLRARQRRPASPLTTSRCDPAAESQ